MVTIYKTARMSTAPPYIQYAAALDVYKRQGYERRVAVAQFLKDGTSGELRALQALSCVKVRATRMPHGFYFQMQEQEQLETRQGIQELFAWVKDRAKECTCICLLYTSTGCRKCDRWNRYSGCIQCSNGWCGSKAGHQQ